MTEVLRGLPVGDWSQRLSATIFCGIGAHLGSARSQNADGHILGHVRDVGADAEDPDTRIYQTNARQTFHTDSTDVVGLLCLRKAKEGGESLLVSAESIYNRLRESRPDLLKLLLEPIATDRRGEIPPGEKPYMTIPPLSWHAGLLTVFGLFGDAVLGFVGISMPAFRVAGGILLFLTALDMLFERRTKRREGQSQPGEDDPSIFPLSIPLIAGPGSIATMILLAGQQGSDWSWVLAVHGVMAAVLLLTFAMFLTAGLLERAIGPVGINVVTRLLGMLLAALSVQFVLEGLADFGFAAG